MNSGTLYLEETKIGYVIREEQVVKGNNYKNGMEQIKNEGEKTAKNDSIYRYYSKNEEKLKTQFFIGFIVAMTRSIKRTKTKISYRYKTTGKSIR